jgi:ABC-type sugar transport system substrate-binding protein
MQRWVRFRGKNHASTTSSAVWSRGVSVRAVVLITAAWGSFGCDSGSFIPPVNPELRGNGGATPVGVTDSTLTTTVSETSPAPARPIEVILGSHAPDEAEGWKSAARMQAGLDKAKHNVSVLEADSPKSKQAEQIREALARHPRALVIEPADPADPDLANAVLAARGQGIPVVLVGQPLTGVKPATATADAAGAKSSASHERQAPAVVIEPKFAASAKQVVDAAIRVTKVSEIDPSGGAIVAVCTDVDPFTAQRVLAIKEALKAAGIANVIDVPVPNDSKAGEKILKETLKAHNKIVMLFGVDAASSLAVREVVAAQDADRLMIAACFTTEDHVANVSRIPHFAAVAEFTPTRVLRKAISTAIALAQGKEMPPVVEFRINIAESSINSNALNAQFQSSTKSGPSPQKKRAD